MNNISETNLNGRGTQADHHDRSRFTFQEGWFELVRPEWEKPTLSLRGKKLHILEVGSFEGASTTWILDNLMSHPESSMTVIDTFEGGMEHQAHPDRVHKHDITALESRFRANVAKCEHVGKLRVMKARSDDALLALRRESARSDFIYVDASHVAIDVLYDAVVCWRMLNVDGMMVFDDFRWKGYMEDCYNPRVAIFGFLRCAAPEVETRETESQMWVTKVLNRVPATPNPDPALYYWEKDNSETLR
jgi:Methyltransferase domain